MSDIELGIAIVGVVLLALVAGAVVVIRDTIRKRGRWGINGQPLHCPTCGNDRVHLPGRLQGT